MNGRDIAALVVLTVGLTQMAGELIGSRVLKGIGAVTVIAPCPKVFCELDGFEPFAAAFTITTGAGENALRIPITAERYSALPGPYNRRNVYGAAIAAAPLLPEKTREHVLRYAFGEHGPLREAMGLSGRDLPITLTIREQTKNRSREWSYRCAQ